MGSSVSVKSNRGLDFAPLAGRRGGGKKKGSSPNGGRRGEERPWLKKEGGGTWYAQRTDRLRGEAWQLQAAEDEGKS